MGAWQVCGRYAALFLLGNLATAVRANDILSSSGFTNCLDSSTITVNRADVQFDRSSGTVDFDVSGSSSKEQKVTASLVVTAYGKEVYQKDFDPCDEDSKVDQLCPVPAGNFAAQGSQKIPASYASQIPSIAFSIPDLDGAATIKLKAAESGENIACIQSGVTNGKSLELPAVSYIAVGIAGAALALTALSALGSAGGVGGHTPTPSFGTVIGWFQSMAMNGMLSVNYPPIYRSFTKNFAFSGGLIPWNSMQTSIDSFRNSTGGNLTTDSVQYLQNASLVFTDGSSNNSTIIAKRNSAYQFNHAILDVRQISTTVNGTQSGNGSDTDTSANNKVTHIVHGIQGYVEQLTIPQANTFMTVLLIFAIIIGAITVGILLFKVILETWALFGSFPKKLTSFRKRYWHMLAKTITNLILLLYGVWTLYCVYQFTNGDSWAAKLLAGLTFGIFTAVLGYFTFRIWQVAHRYKKAEGDASALYENKETWIKYSIFYDVYKQGYWWLFMPVIVYMFAKGCVIAIGDGHGLAQTAGQLIIESLMLLLLLWNRPYATLAGNWINVIIQTVRVLSVICILVFVEQLGIAQTTKTITGVVLIAVQTSLTAILAILIAVNAVITCCKENPHRKRRKEAEKLNREFDNLTPLDARNSLLINLADYKGPAGAEDGHAMGTHKAGKRYEPVPPYNDQVYNLSRWGARESSENLVASAASPGQRDHPSTRRGSDDSSLRPLSSRQPTLPDIGYGGRRVV